ncbi:hypothetical protein Tco_0256609 [Tanacetum coccineum]
MGDANPIRTLGDYSKPRHEGYRNTIELRPLGDTMWYNLCSTPSGKERACWEIDRAAGGKIRNKNPDESGKSLRTSPSTTMRAGMTQKNSPSSTHVPQAYAEAVYSNPHPRNQNESPKQSPFTFRERTGPIPQPQALGTTFKARVWDYMAAYTERMERFENAIFKQREEINDNMAEIFRIFKELTTSRAPKKVLIREEAKSLVTKM